MTRYGDDVEASNSEFQTFTDCGRRWWLSYYRGLKPLAEKPVGPLSIGSRVHRALEEGYSSPGRGEAAMSVLLDSLTEDYPKASQLGPEVLKQFQSEAELCVIMLEGFVQWASEEGLDAGWEVVAHERIVKASPMDIHGERVIFKGKLDQMIRRDMDGSLWMRDWKTTQTMTPVMMAFGPQLKMYLLLLALTEPDAQVSGGQFVFLKKVKRTARANPPFYSIEPFYVGPPEMESFFLSTMGTAKRMVETMQKLEAGGNPLELVPPRPTRDCSWRCPFYLACPMFDDGSNVEGYLEANYTSGDPYAYYGDLVEKTADVD